MECEIVKKEFPNIKFEECCISCHEDSDMGYGDDLWFVDPNGKDRNVCCALYRSFEKVKNESNK